VLVCARCRHANNEGAKFCEECGYSLAVVPAGAKEQRKTVTVLFCDLTGSTALGETLDPERLRALLARYYERMKGIVERHGGSVEKFMGDAVMAVFGVPVLHEDDALRALRAAAEMRDALPELGLQGRIGVMTGEVVTGTEERLATGDAVNVAARLEQAAEPGDALIGAPTLALVGDAAEVAPFEPLVLKGKAKPVHAYRLLNVRDAPERRDETLFVGRDREVAVVGEVWERVRADQRCELFTVVGEAGIGKSRLVAEALGAIEARVVRGRCLPYGDGITYWPVVEVLKQLGMLPDDEAVAVAIRSLLGETEAVTSAEEIAWAFRKTLEHAASERPLVVVFDDIQWGEETFLDLVEHVALLSSGASILLLCMARPELAQRRSTWPVTLRLGALVDEDVEELIPESFPVELRERIGRAAAGNPLFIREMLSMAQESEVDVVVPPSLKALLAARLDQLERGERIVLERAAVEGEIFHRGAVQSLTASETQVTPRLAALVRKELIRPERSQLPGEDGFRFRHLLIRDAAYNALPKLTRAELHQRFAAWLEQHGTELVELDEILGYHLEQACRYRAELALPPDDALTAAARRRLSAAGHRAFSREDSGAAVRLLERAAALVPPSEIDLALELVLATSLIVAGRGGEALQCARSLTERASAAGNRVAELCGRIRECLFDVYLEPEGAIEKLAAMLEEAMPVFQAADDDVALYLGYTARGHVAASRGQYDAMLEAYDHAAVHAGRTELPYEQLLLARTGGRLSGTTPVPELLTWLDEQKARGVSSQYIRGLWAEALAMRGRFDEARAILAEARTKLAERGGRLWLAVTTGHSSARVELLAGDPAAAAAFGEEGFRLLSELGEKSAQASAAGVLAQALYALDRLDEADAWAGRTAEIAASDDLGAQMVSNQVKAKVLARRGEHGPAERLAREAVAIAEDTDMLDAQGDTYADLGEVLLLTGKGGQAVAALEQAVARYERKGNHVSAQRAQTRLAELRAAAPR
jgi:class 3 adenylate cyclase/tetratricopeptide (TPR) repeat protein